MDLRGKQKRFLRSEAHHLNPIFQIGKGGLNDAMMAQIEEALEKRELIKVSLLQNTDEVADEAAETIREKVGCEVVQIIGRKIVLYREGKEDRKKIVLP